MIHHYLLPPTAGPSQAEHVTLLASAYASALHHDQALMAALSDAAVQLCSSPDGAGAVVGHVVRVAAALAALNDPPHALLRRLSRIPLEQWLPALSLSEVSALVLASCWAVVCGAVRGVPADAAKSDPIPVCSNVFIFCYVHSSYRSIGYRSQTLGESGSGSHCSLPLAPAYVASPRALSRPPCHTPAWPH